MSYADIPSSSSYSTVPSSIPPSAQNKTKRRSRPRSATVSSAAGGTGIREGSSRQPRERRTSARPAPLPPLSNATRPSIGNNSSAYHGARTTPTPSRSSFSAESTTTTAADSLRSRSMTVSSNNTTVYSTSQSFDLGARSLKSSTASSHRSFAPPHPPRPLQQPQRYGFPMPPTADNTVLWPGHAPVSAQNMNPSQTMLATYHDEPQSYVSAAAMGEEAGRLAEGGSGTSSNGSTSATPGSASGSGSVSGSSGWKAIARKASGRFRRSFSTSGSMVSLAQEAEKHPMPANSIGTHQTTTPQAAHAGEGGGLPTPAVQVSSSLTAPQAPANGSSDNLSSSPSSPSTGFLGHMLSRKKSRDSLTGSDTGGKKPRPTWNDLPPSPSALPAAVKHANPTVPPTSTSPSSHQGYGRSLKIGKSKQRLDQVVVTPFELAPLSPAAERPSVDRHGFLASPAAPSLRRASMDHTASTGGSGRSHRPHHLPRSASALVVGMPRSTSPNNSTPASPTSSSIISRGSSVNSSPPPLFSDDDDPPPVPPLPSAHEHKSPITFSQSNSTISNMSSLTSSSSSSNTQLNQNQVHTGPVQVKHQHQHPHLNLDSPGRSSSAVSSSSLQPQYTPQAPHRYTPRSPTTASITPQMAFDDSPPSSEPTTPQPATAQATQTSPSPPPSPPPATAVPAKALRFPASFGFVPRPDADEGPDEQFGASASAASAPIPYGSHSQLLFLSTSSETAMESDNSNSNGSHQSLVPPKRSQSLSPFASSQRESQTSQPPAKRDKKLEFEELLASDIGTMRLSLTPNRTKR